MAVYSNYFIATYIQKQTICKLKKKKRKPTTKDNRILTLLYFTFMEFLLFLTMSIFVKTVMLIRIYITVYLMVSLAVNIFKKMRTKLAFLCSEP